MSGLLEKEESGLETVAIVGMGGLGCPAARTLAEGGIAHLVLIDDDTIELSNLQRQPLYGTEDIGRSKLDVASERLQRDHPNLTITRRSSRLASASVDQLLGGADLVIDATDDPDARFLINDWALANGVPAVLGGVLQFQGLVLAVASGHGPCFRCLFETPPDRDELPTCASAGVLGALAGFVGHLQAERALALLAGDEDNTTGFVTTIDAIRGRVRHVPLPHPPNCAACRAASPTQMDDPAGLQESLMAIQIKIPASLRKFVGGTDTVDVEAVNVRDALDGLETAHPGIKAKLCDDNGNVRRFINIYANSEDIRFLDNLDTTLGEGAEVQIVPAIAGGR
ncbi:MAG: molybdopterin/thiamine biosynthesis adenylyltransferase [Myxococcota bacterium]